MPDCALQTAAMPDHIYRSSLPTTAQCQVTHRPIDAARIAHSLDAHLQPMFITRCTVYMSISSQHIGWRHSMLKCCCSSEKISSILSTSRNITTLRLSLNAYHAACSICLGLFALRCYLPAPIDTLYSKNVGTQHSVRNMALGKFCILFTFGQNSATD